MTGVVYANSALYFDNKYSTICLCQRYVNAELNSLVWKRLVKNRVNPKQIAPILNLKLFASIVIHKEHIKYVPKFIQ